jgi:hypothetical protein
VGDVATLKLTGAWASYLKVLDPVEFQERLEHEVRRANDRIGRQFMARARRAIRDGKYAPNSPITVILKGSSKPLVDKGDLAQQISYEIVSWNEVRVGLTRAKVGSKNVNLGMILHEGATIDVEKHPAVRRRLWAMVREALGPGRKLNGRQRASIGAAAQSLGMALGGKKPRKKPMSKRQLGAMWASKGKVPGTGKKVWVIPARPFIREPLTDAAFTKWVRGEWVAAAGRALFGDAAP